MMNVRMNIRKFVKQRFGGRTALRSIFSPNFLCVLTFILVQQTQFIYGSSFKTSNTKFGIWIERSPESTVAPQGDEVLFECEINTTPDRIEWRFRHDSIMSNFSGFEIMEKTNITNDDKTSKLRIYVSLDTIGEYQCVAWFGTSALASIKAQLSLASIMEVNESNMELDKNFQHLDSNSMKWKVAPKNSVVIKCGSIQSNPPPVWTFYKNDIPILPVDPEWPAGSLILENVSYKDTGIYSCSAMNSITGQEIKLKQNIELTVDYTQNTPPHFLISPATKISAFPGQTVLLECPGVGNPYPKPVWSSPKVTNHMSNNRTTILPYGLRIVNVQPEDNGTYTCRLDNGLRPVLFHLVKLEVYEKPVIIKGPGLSLANESYPWELECEATGTPTPHIYWVINGVDTRTDNSISQRNNTLVFSVMKKAYAGIVQCFAKNQAGETFSSNLLHVNPQQLNSSILGQGQIQHSADHKLGKQKKKHKSPTMIPPNRPTVSRLSDDSVMLRWSVPKNDGLDITFFKVQYKMLERTKTTARGNWQTTNEEIAYGKRDNKIKNFTIPVSGLLPDHYYRFRILAVYSNNDNKEGPSTGKFLLQSAASLGKDRGFLPAPNLTSVERISENTIFLQWYFPDNIYVDGFYVHYRSVSSAGDYTKQTVEGMKTRHCQIENLESNIAYEFKLQSFTLTTASDFSVILTALTIKQTTTPIYIKKVINDLDQQTTQSNVYYTVIAGTAGGSFLVLVAVILAFLVFKWRKNTSHSEGNKPHIDHIQADSHMPHTIHKNNHRLNGVMNITPNPLAHESDKTQFQRSSSPFYLLNKPTSNSQTSSSPTLLHKELSNNHNNFKSNCQYTNSTGNTCNQDTQSPDFTKRMTEKTNRNIHFTQSPSAFNNTSKTKENRLPTLRATFYNGCNNEIVGLAGSPKFQRSPKQNILRNHIGTLNDNMSSGSLNSIEV